MLSGKFCSIKDLVWMLYRDLGTEENISLSDCAEWAVECINLIYQPSSYVKIITGHGDNPDFDITNYKVQLPCNLVSIVAVSVDGYAAVPASGQFHMLQGGLCCGIDELTTQAISSGQFIDNFGNVFDAELGSGTSGNYTTYEVNNGWLTLSIKEGKVCLAYLAIATDECGLPLIPDDIHYKEAIKRFITKNIDYIRFRQNPTERAYRELYEDSEKQYCWAIGAASNKGKAPDTNKMESIKRTLLRIRPDINKFNSFFATQNLQEERKIR